MGIRQRFSFIVACTAVLVGVGCHRTAEHSRVFTIKHEVTPHPVQVGPVTVTFTLADAAATPVAGAHINVEADMTHAGMSPVFGDAKEIEPGRYQSQLTLGMAGDWVILLHATLPDGEKLERRFDVNNVRRK